MLAALGAVEVAVKTRAVVTPGTPARVTATLMAMLIRTAAGREMEATLGIAETQGVRMGGGMKRQKSLNSNWYLRLSSNESRIIS